MRIDERVVRSETASNVGISRGARVTATSRTAVFLCAELDIEGQLQHAGHIENWIALLRDDSRAIFTAASQGSRAADYLKTFSMTSSEG
jgi:antirestriction protein ArdC